MTSTTLRRHGTTHGRGRMGQIVLGPLDPAYRYGRSIFSSRVFDPDEVQRVLKTGHQSRKIGKTVMKGKRRGWPIFTLTLEERATCPPTCAAWAFCYGNNMQAAERILGDFYSEDYVRFWTSALDRFPALHVFGFTAHDPGSPIGRRLYAICRQQWERFAVRFSGMDGPLLASQLQPDVHPAAIPCPAQTGGSDCCATCMLCIYSQRSISFARH
jgi:hypothetical protein